MNYIDEQLVLKNIIKEKVKDLTTRNFNFNLEYIIDGTLSLTCLAYGDKEEYLIRINMLAHNMIRPTFLLEEIQEHIDQYPNEYFNMSINKIQPKELFVFRNKVNESEFTQLDKEKYSRLSIKDLVLLEGWRGIFYNFENDIKRVISWIKHKQGVRTKSNNPSMHYIKQAIEANKFIENDRFDKQTREVINGKTKDI